MREILFKAKRKDNGEWVVGYCCKITIGNDVRPIDVIFVPLKVNRNEEWGWMKVDSDTICQYTGLTDKNGRRIWENDIVSAWSEGKNAIGKVIRRADGLYIMYPAYQNKEFWGLCPKKNGKTTVEVIGNIFDNTDLLEVE